MALDYYDGSTAPNAQIEKHLNVRNKETKLNYIKQARAALGLPPKNKGGIGNHAENVLVIDWLKANKQPWIAPKVKKKRVKTKRGSRYSEFTSIAFNVTGIESRQNVSLEKEYITALELIAPTNRNEWLSECVSEWIAANGDESTTRIVKASIVNALIKGYNKANKQVK